MTDHLKETRNKSLEDASTISEAEIHQTNPQTIAVWQQMQDLQRKIIQEKAQASKDIDDKYREEMQSLRSEYAMLLTMIR